MCLQGVEMLTHDEETHISIDPENKVIKFERRLQRNDCKHLTISISVQENTVHCNDCDKDLNPVWWIKHHLEELNSLIARNSQLLAQRKIIDEKFKSRRYYVCEHCNESNMIDFSRLTSASSIKKQLTELQEGETLKQYFRTDKK